MVSPNPAVLDRQISRVSRRLYLQTFLDQVVWCWASALVLAAAWFFLQPYVVAEPAAPWLRWAVAGGLIGLATGLAALLARFRAPSRLIAALSLDERFGLKERVTTSLTLAPDQATSPAGQALLADVNQRVSSLDVTSKFPVSVSWSALAVPVCVALFAAVAFFYEPPKINAVVDPNDDAKQAPANVAKVDEAMKQLKKKPVQKAEGKPREELEKLEAKLDEIANRPRRTKEELRERYKELKATEEMMRRRENQLGDKADARQTALKKLDKLNEGAKEGPAKDLQKALSQGNLEQAKQELEKISKKLDQMSPKEKEQLAKQMKEMGEKLKQLSDNEQKKEQLEKLKKEGKIDQETYEREKKQLDKQSESLKDLKDLAQKMNQCKKCLEKGDSQGAQRQLDDAAKQMEEMDGDSKEMEDLREQMKRLKDAKDAAKNGMGKNQDDKDPEPRDMDEDQPNNGGIGAGRRPMGKDHPTRAFDTKARLQFDPKGKKIFDGYAPGQNFRKKSTAEIIEDIEQASQESSEALEQQRISRQARDMAKGYFRNLGGQADGKKPPPK
jgi:hypothetical protein